MNHDPTTRCDRSAIRGPPGAVPNKTLAWGARRRHRGKQPAPAANRHPRMEQTSTATAAQDKEN